MSSRINPESFIVVKATVQCPLKPVKSCRVADFELPVAKCFVLAAASTVLDMTLTTSNRPVTNFSHEKPMPTENGKVDADAANAVEKPTNAE